MLGKYGRSTRRAPRAHKVQGQLSGSKRFSNRAASACGVSGCPPTTRSCGSASGREAAHDPTGTPVGRGQGTGSFHRAEWPTGTSDRGEGSRGAAGAEKIPPATHAARNSSQRLRAGFTVPLPPKPGGCKDRGGGSPRPPLAPQNLLLVLAIKSTSDEIKRAREGEDRRVGGGTDLSMRILWSPIQGMRCCPCSWARARSSSRNSLQA